MPGVLFFRVPEVALSKLTKVVEIQQLLPSDSRTT